MKNIRIKFHKNIRISEMGYLHIPILWVGCGKDGFLIEFPFFGVTVACGKKLKESLNKK